MSGGNGDRSDSGAGASGDSARDSDSGDNGDIFRHKGPTKKGQNLFTRTLEKAKI